MNQIADDCYPTGTRYPTNHESYRAIVADILRDVAEDVARGDAETVAYLDTPHFAHYCELLDVDPVAARERLLKLAGTLPPSTRYVRRGVWKANDYYHEIHRVYMAEGLTMAATAERFGIKTSTLSSRFYKMGLPTRPRWATESASAS